MVMYLVHDRDGRPTWASWCWVIYVLYSRLTGWDYLRQRGRIFVQIKFFSQDRFYIWSNLCSWKMWGTSFFNIEKLMDDLIKRISHVTSSEETNFIKGDIRFAYSLVSENTELCFLRKSTVKKLFEENRDKWLLNIP